LEELEENERRRERMKRRKWIHLFLPVALFLVLASCHTRRVSDIKPNMTKEEVASLWGRTPLVTHKTVDGKTVEIWEYHFSGSGSVCRVTFSDERVAATQCSPLRAGTYYSFHRRGKPFRAEFVREGYFARLADALKLGEVKSEAKPKAGWLGRIPPRTMDC
jgi:hypothetical protein